MDIAFWGKCGLALHTRGTTISRHVPRGVQLPPPYENGRNVKQVEAGYHVTGSCEYRALGRLRELSTTPMWEHGRNDKQAGRWIPRLGGTAISHPRVPRGVFGHLIVGV